MKTKMVALVLLTLSSCGGDDPAPDAKTDVAVKSFDVARQSEPEIIEPPLPEQTPPMEVNPIYLPPRPNPWDEFINPPLPEPMPCIRC